MSTTSTTTWTTSNRVVNLSIDGGTATPFIMQGVAYSPTPIGGTSIPDPLGAQNSAIWQRDLPLLRAMGTNTIRIYGMDASNRNNSDDFLEAAWNGGTDPIYVILSIWVNPSGNGIADLDTLEKQYKWIGEDYGNHPAVLGISIGSEFNTPQNITTQTFWNDFNTLANAAKSGISSAGGQKLISTGFVDFVNTSNQESTVVEGESFGAVLDIWGINSYRGSTFTNLWQQIESATTKPFIITEFGAPASYHPNNQSCQASELPASGSPSMSDLVTYMEGLWNEIETNWANNSGKVGSGGFIFEWSDEWWKSPQCGNSSEHSGGSAQNGAFPGGWDDEEWFGLNSIAAGTPNVLTQRATYNAIKGLWT